MARTGATLIGSYETVRVMEAAGVPVDRMICVAGGERIASADDVSVSVYPSQHSCVWSHAADGAVGRGVPRRPRRDVAGAAGADAASCASTWRPRSPGRDASTCGASSRATATAATAARCSSCSRRRRARCCTRTRPATGRGILDGLRPDVAILAAAGRANIDGEPIQGSLADFVGRPGRGRCGPRRLLLSHHDDWLPGLLGADRHGADPRRDRRGVAGTRAARARLPRRHRRVHRPARPDRLRVAGTRRRPPLVDLDERRASGSCALAADATGRRGFLSEVAARWRRRWWRRPCLPWWH